MKIGKPIRNIKDGGFAWFDKRALSTICEKCEESATAIAVYVALCNIASDRRCETFQVSQAKIASMTKLSRRTVWARLQDLEKAGVIRSIRTPNGKIRETCLYALLSMNDSDATIGLTKKPEAAGKSRKLDCAFEALMEIEGYRPGQQLLRSERRKINSILKEIREVYPDVTGAEIRDRFKQLNRNMPWCKHTVTSLVKHWSKCEPEQEEPLMPTRERPPQSENPSEELQGNRAEKIRRSIEYRNQLQDQRWKDLARRKREQAGFQCEACGDSSEQLHVHHICYHKGRMAWEYALSELKCLCRTCHILTHAPKQKINLFKDKKEDE